MKGPNDKLSTKQQIWLDVLVRLGAEAEVLYVKGSCLFVEFRRSCMLSITILSFSCGRKETLAMEKRREGHVISVTHATINN